MTYMQRRKKDRPQEKIPRQGGIRRTKQRCSERSGRGEHNIVCGGCRKKAGFGFSAGCSLSSSSGDS